MSKEGHAVAVLTGELTVEQRLAVLDRFRKGHEKVLITTNVLSRGQFFFVSFVYSTIMFFKGIDVEQVTIVVNFNLPVDLNGMADCETYLHRIGRTGRFGKRGIAINLVESQQDMAILQAIEKHFNRKIKYLNADDSDEIERIGS